MATLRETCSDVAARIRAQVAANRANAVPLGQRTNDFTSISTVHFLELAMELEAACAPAPAPDDPMQAGFDDVRAALLAGLGRFADGTPMNVPGNYLMGAFTTLVLMIWENRAAGVQQMDVVAGLATVLGEQIAFAAADCPDAGPAVRAGSGQALVNAFTAVVRAWAPRDDGGRSVIDARALLDGVAYFAALQVNSVPRAEARAQAAQTFAEALGAYLVRIPTAPSATIFTQKGRHHV